MRVGVTCYDAPSKEGAPLFEYEVMNGRVRVTGALCHQSAVVDVPDGMRLEVRPVPREEGADADPS